MSAEEIVRKALASRGRMEGGDIDEADPVVVNLVAAVRELQDAVYNLAQHVDQVAPEQQAD